MSESKKRKRTDDVLSNHLKEIDETDECYDADEIYDDFEERIHDLKSNMMEMFKNMIKECDTDFFDDDDEDALSKWKLNMKKNLLKIDKIEKIVFDIDN